jgi:peptidyl-prolyl cis-trans isomerase B (cyclophilin B)
MKQYASYPAMVIDLDKTYTVTITTNRGVITLQLDALSAPKTVNNFVFLAKDNFYDGIVFHRVIPDFMIQTGDPEGTGRGGPGYRFGDETTGNPNSHERGVISMANAAPGTNGSQFFITHVPCAWLNGKHTVFGKVTSGLDIVDSIKQGDVMQTVVVTES